MEARGIMFRRLALVGLSVAMVGCGGQLEKAQQATPPEDEYGKGLYTGYVDLSSREYNEGDYRDSDFFANRAIAVSEKTSFEAQFVDARDVPGETIEDMANARRQLVTAPKYSAVSGNAMSSMLIGSAGVRNIDSTKTISSVWQIVV